jgi:3-methyladenine DNA glycosylase AlkC
MEPLKLMYNTKKLDELGRLIMAEYKSFQTMIWLAHFKTKEWQQAELKQRVTLIAQAMHATLPDNYDKAIDILKPVSLKMAYGFFGVVFSEFVAIYGRKHWDKSMEAMAIFTQTSSAEFAIRFFIQDDPKRAMKQMELWSKSENVHLRRLSSEGCRPRLPWGMKLQLFVDDPTPTLRVLERLKKDPELYVRKSVANHLNDISKDNPTIALGIAKDWFGVHPDTDWIVKHSLRTLLKSGDKEALEIMGQSFSKHLSVDRVQLMNERISLGETIEFEVTVCNASKKNENMRLEYAIDYMKANGKRSRKVFQWINKTITPGNHQFKKRQTIKDFTTRKHYAGQHGWAVLVNGRELGQTSFELAIPTAKV